MRRWSIVIILVFIMTRICMSQTTVRISGLKGDVKIRRGMEESWDQAGIGLLLNSIDTILTGEASEVVLELSEGTTFLLGSQAILDIADLRKITERELFLYLMSQKINKIEPRNKNSKLHIENVSVVRAERKTMMLPSKQTAGESMMWHLEINGAKALYSQRYYTNAIVKFHKIIEKYPDYKDCGRTHYYLGRSFEKINETGRAIDAYQQVLERLKNNSCENAYNQSMAKDASEAIIRLKK